MKNTSVFNNISTSLRTGRESADIQQSFKENLFYSVGRLMRTASTHDLYRALALSVRDRVMNSAMHSTETYLEKAIRAVAYFSAEYLPGPHLANNLLNLGMTEETREAMSELGFDLDLLMQVEEEPGLGNGGLGRLASCYMDSLASLEMPAIGYGIRYEFGIFDQVIREGWQMEITDKWLHYGNPWEVQLPELGYYVGFGGKTEYQRNDKGELRVVWKPDFMVKGTPYDTPIPGFRVNNCNYMRLWKAEAVESFDFSAFNHGNYYKAIEDKIASENLTKVLYPNDEHLEGKLLRLQQQYFFVSCSLQDMIYLFLLRGGELKQFHEKWVAQLNDTHPAIAVAELMRLLMDVHHLGWDTAWEITRNTFGYTNHTLLPEALEKWPMDLFASQLPRHLEIILEINHRFLDEVRNKGITDEGMISRLSIIDESGGKFVRMANLACVGSFKVNGVARLHSELLKSYVMKDFAQIWPEKFCNITNGITPRRFLALSNPPLAELINNAIGDHWLKDLNELRKLEAFLSNPGFRSQWEEVKQRAKNTLSILVEERTGIEVNPESLFDIQVKRIHEYKRQHLNILHILACYLALKNNPDKKIPPRTFLFGGKAAPGYFMAKLIIRLITGVAKLLNHDPATRDYLKVVFFPDFNVKNAQFIYPAANLSEQISTAGKEASGTGNMKFSLNGALTIGTEDGANIEIKEEVGAENFFQFGLTISEIRRLKSKGYQPGSLYESNDAIKSVLDFILSGAVSDGDTKLFKPLVEKLIIEDPFFVLADFEDYRDKQNKVNQLWLDRNLWTEKSILNTARMGKFSSDRSIREYATNIWRLDPVKVIL